MKKNERITFLPMFFNRNQRRMKYIFILYVVHLNERKKIRKAFDVFHCLIFFFLLFKCEHVCLCVCLCLYTYLYIVAGWYMKLFLLCVFTVKEVW